MADPRHRRGRLGEDAATAELERRGYIVLERNFRCRYGEIDIIARCQDVLCFIEVRTRRQGALVDGRNSITYSKRRRVVRTAQFFIGTHRIEPQPMRFDVVDVCALPDGSLHAEIIPNAFDVEAQL